MGDSQGYEPLASTLANLKVHCIQNKRSSISCLEEESLLGKQQQDIKCPAYQAADVLVIAPDSISDMEIINDDLAVIIVYAPEVDRETLLEDVKVPVIRLFTRCFSATLFIHFGTLQSSSPL